MPRRRWAASWAEFVPASSRCQALLRFPASSRAAAPTTGWTPGSHYPHSIRGANGWNRQGFVGSSHTLPATALTNHRAEEAGLEPLQANNDRRNRPRPLGSTPEPGELGSEAAAPGRARVTVARSLFKNFQVRWAGEWLVREELGAGRLRPGDPRDGEEPGQVVDSRAGRDAASVPATGTHSMWG